MSSTMRVAAAQLPNVVGDLDGNAERIAGAMAWAEQVSADVLVLPELVLTGYPLSDLALHAEFVADAEAVLADLARASGDVVTVLSTITSVPPQQTWDSWWRDRSISAVLLSGGEIRGIYHKVLLPTQGAYDEGRTFAPGREPAAVWRIGDVVAGVSICEDLWSGDGPPEAQPAAGARILLSPNASPYHRGKAGERRDTVERVARRNGVPVVYVNLVGGQDELVFDGGSLIADRDGTVVCRAAEFTEDRLLADVELPAPRAVAGSPATVHTRPLADRTPTPAAPVAQGEIVAGVWEALVMGTRDFVVRNGYTDVVLGLSGGIDAAVTAAVAAEAFGGAHVCALAMPSADTPDEERADAEEVAAALGVSFEVVPLDEVMAALGNGLRRRTGDVLDEPAAAAMQARARAALLQAIAEHRGSLVLSTVNKTELSIGEATVHGDAAGGFAPLRDCPKTLLYALARHRNARGEVISERILAKPTTAQHRAERAGWPPPYRVLDEVVERYIEHGDGIEELVRSGFEPALATEIVRRIHDAEFLRRLTPPGVKVTARAFSFDRKVPITQAWRPHRRPEAIEWLGRGWRDVTEA